MTLGRDLLGTLMQGALAPGRPASRPGSAADDGGLDGLALRLVDRPAKSTAEIIGVATVLFYAAERGHNPKVTSIFDALVYTTTCLSVGYGDIFAKTPVGKLVGSALMTMGPALSGAALDGPRGNKADDAVEREILTTLKEILARMPEPPVG